MPLASMYCTITRVRRRTDSQSRIHTWGRGRGAMPLISRPRRRDASSSSNVPGSWTVVFASVPDKGAGDRDRYGCHSFMVAPTPLLSVRAVHFRAPNGRGSWRGQRHPGPAMQRRLRRRSARQVSRRWISRYVITNRIPFPRGDARPSKADLQIRRACPAPAGDEGALWLHRDYKEKGTRWPVAAHARERWMEAPFPWRPGAEKVSLAMVNKESAANCQLMCPWGKLVAVERV